MKRKAPSHNQLAKALAKRTGMPHAHAKAVIHAAHRKAFEAANAQAIQGIARVMLQQHMGGQQGPPGMGGPPQQQVPPPPPQGGGMQ